MKKIVLFIVTVLVVCSGANAQLTTKVPKTLGEAALRRSAPQMEMKKIDEAVKVLPISKTRLNNVPVKEVLSSKKLKNGTEFRIVRLENGIVKKQLINPAKQLQRKISPNKKPETANSTAVAVAPESLHEGFEGWDEETWDWLPAGWTDESKAGSDSDLKDIYGDRYNFTWRTTYHNSKKGLYSAGVQFALVFDILSGEDTIEYNPPMPQDEWLISPAVTVKQADYVYAFDLYYDPFWGRFHSYRDENGEIVYEFDAMHTVVEALISIDGGNTWTKKWDNVENAAGYTEDELWDIAFETGPPWLKVSIGLGEYLNKDIKVAIRYLDDGGESVYVDNVTVGYPIPDASYRRPGGYLISGLSPDMIAFNGINLIIGDAYTPTKWIGRVENHESVSWSFSDANQNPIQTTTEQNPTVTLPYGLFDTPLLTATGIGDNNKTEFRLGGDADYSWIGLGGQNVWEGQNGEDVVLGLGNYDLQYRFAIDPMINTEDLAHIGTFKGVSNYFEKPINKYVVENFYVHACDVVAKPGEPIKLNLYAITEDYIVDTVIATSEAYPEDFIVHEIQGVKYYTIPFKFKAIDPETGRETDSYLEIDNHFLAEFYNYESADVLIQYENHPTGDSYAYISFEDRLLLLGPTSFYFDTDAVFSFLHVLNDGSHTGGRYAVPVEGGTKEFQLISYWSASGWWLKEALPDWISIGEPVFYAAGDYNYTLPVTVSPLPQGVKGRKADVTIQAPGCEMTLEIKQGEAWWTGINPAGASKNVKVANQGDRLVLSYPSGTASVAVYNVAGQKIGEYALNPDGTHSIPAAHWSRGVYILKFAGKTNETVKVIK